jgi:hypothetical protein
LEVIIEGEVRVVDWPGVLPGVVGVELSGPG